MKRILLIAVIGLASLSIVNSVYSISVLFRKRDLLIAAQKALEKEKKENKTLQYQLQKVSRPDFVEEEARNKLFFAKPGENTIFIAKELLIHPAKEKPIQKEQSNWEQWVGLFL